MLFAQELGSNTSHCQLKKGKNHKKSDHPRGVIAVFCREIASRAANPAANKLGKTGKNGDDKGNGYVAL